MITPTIGRKVWYFPPEGEGTKLGNQAFDATVIFVHSDSMVNLAIVDHVGRQMVREHVVLLQDGKAPGQLKSHCEWMPYQVGQAKAHVQMPHSGIGGFGVPDRPVIEATNAK